MNMTSLPILMIWNTNTLLRIWTNIFLTEKFQTDIYHQCHGDPLQNSQAYYETIFNSDFKGYEDRTRNQAMSSAIKAERDDIHFQVDVLKIHIKSDNEKDLISNDIFVKKSKSKKWTAADCKSLKQ